MDPLSGDEDMFNHRYASGLVGNGEGVTGVTSYVP